MNIAFLTEMGFSGKILPSYVNMRTEFCWMLALNAEHFNIYTYDKIKDYDHVFVIIPKGDFYLNAVGARLVDKPNSISTLLKSNFTEILKNNNKKVHFIQEGSTTLFNDWSVEDQFYYFNHLQNFDILFAHNDYDIPYYRGMFPDKKIETIPTLMLTHLLQDIVETPQNKVMIGGNMSRFYGGFQSYIIANEFENYEKWTMTSHAKREDESSIPDLVHLPRLNWVDWMKQLSTFKIGIHMMPIYAAGTFMVNCAYFGIPCIAPSYTNTQREFYTYFQISSAEDIQRARLIAHELATNPSYYNNISTQARETARQSIHTRLDKWVAYMEKIINE